MSISLSMAGYLVLSSLYVVHISTLMLCSTASRLQEWGMSLAALLYQKTFLSGVLDRERGVLCTLRYLTVMCNDRRLGSFEGWNLPNLSTATIT